MGRLFVSVFLVRIVSWKGFAHGIQMSPAVALLPSSEKDHVLLWEWQRLFRTGSWSHTRG